MLQHVRFQFRGCLSTCLFVCFCNSVNVMFHFWNAFFVICIFSGAARRALRADAVLCLIIEFSHCSYFRVAVIADRYEQQISYILQTFPVFAERARHRDLRSSSLDTERFERCPRCFSYSLSPSLHLWCSLNWNRLSSEPNVKTNQWPRWREKAERRKEWMKR